ncbi:MAG: hypothetical protein GQ570_11905 [Helicobacteraceae bacterium]|nr:hypothetical protein [Helicobacteraceae bacterium]
MSNDILTVGKPETKMVDTLKQEDIMNIIWQHYKSKGLKVSSSMTNVSTEEDECTGKSHLVSLSMDITYV